MIAGDLSDFERVRLENIKRNAEFLIGLGLDVKANADLHDAASTGLKTKKRGRSSQPVVPGRRTSPRLNLQKESLNAAAETAQANLEDVNNTTEIETKEIDYETMPERSEDLDDYEFEVYAHLKGWRLQRCQELDIEPYKICQNRTLAELIRRRRNNKHWASEEGNSEGSDHKKEKDLLECWGIGPSKAKEGGFGFELIQEIDNHQHTLKLLTDSRNLSVS